MILLSFVINLCGILKVCPKSAHLMFALDVTNTKNGERGTRNGSLGTSVQR